MLKRKNPDRRSAWRTPVHLRAQVERAAEDASTGQGKCLQRWEKFRRQQLRKHCTPCAFCRACAQNNCHYVADAARCAANFLLDKPAGCRARHLNSGTLHVRNDRRRRDGVYLCRHAVGDHWAVRCKHSRSQAQQCGRTRQARRISVENIDRLRERRSAWRPCPRIATACFPARRYAGSLEGGKTWRAVRGIPRRAQGKLRLRRLVPCSEHPYLMPAPPLPGKSSRWWER
jgi:hypothetical protein